MIHFTVRNLISFSTAMAFITRSVFIYNLVVFLETEKTEYYKYFMMSFICSQEVGGIFSLSQVNTKVLRCHL